MKKYKTPEEKFWAGKFGNKYLTRNYSSIYYKSNKRLFDIALKKSINIKSCIELGAGSGQNIKYLKKKYPKAHFQAVEINKSSTKQINKVLNKEDVFNESILKFNTKKKFDLVLTKGVLIHLNPNKLNKIYKLLFKLSKKYILISEYYNPTPVQVTYRGHKNRLYKRDFAGELLRKFKKIKLIDYGFIYKNDPKYPLDDASWFLLKK
jgi:pseudaminic acid biosynthesis-associated methylase